ncbi:MAG TPA: ATP-binding protein, partial [Ktedonobacterales bacterium]|nr:ATP-binding protein [Ktedonobacterales bacterium]
RLSLLIQLVSVYLAFVLVVLVAGIGVNALAEQRLRHEVEVSDQALAEEIALATQSQFEGAATSLVTLGKLVLRSGTAAGITGTFQAFVAARSDVEHVYWLDKLGRVVVSVRSPTSAPDSVGIGAEFSPNGVTDQALAQTGPAFEVGIAQQTTLKSGVTLASAVRDANDRLMGIVVMTLSLEDLSAPLTTVINQQPKGRHLLISIIDHEGVLIATSDQRHILDNVLSRVPGAALALATGTPNSEVGPGPNHQNWLYSSVPVTGPRWAVVVQRPSDEALDVIAQLHWWLATAAMIFAIGVAVFWWTLVRRVIRPLHLLAERFGALPAPGPALVAASERISARRDEVGSLGRSLERLERDVRDQLGELQTLLETSNAVVTSLDPAEVGSTIISEVQRLVKVEAAAVLVPDDAGVLQVLVSEGRNPAHDAAIHLQPDELELPAVRALRERRPVQMIADDSTAFPPISYGEGFRSVLAVPITSSRVGDVVLVVHRVQAQPFSAGEMNLLLTFANYATLAWEHAQLYARSDEELRKAARDNQRLYRLTHNEKRRLEAIMGSMTDGLVLAGADGRVLYANPGAALLTGLRMESLATGTIGSVHSALRAAVVEPERYDRALAEAEVGTVPGWTIEAGQGASRRAIALRLFAVRDDAGDSIGRGLLLRDVTLERDADEFKTTLLTAVGHELRTPLAAIKGHASTLLQDDVTWSPAEQQHSLRIMAAEVDRITDLVRDLLDLSQQQAGVLPLHREEWRLADLIASAAQRVDADALRVEVALPGDLPLVSVDRARVEVVLRNLLENALAYGGTIATVSATAYHDVIEVAVHDDGPGIEPDALAHLFERFYRSGYGMRRRSQGTGLGLAICKAFVEAHGGAITAESGTGGATIRFTLPLAAPVSQPGDRAGADFVDVVIEGEHIQRGNDAWHTHPRRGG